MEEAAPLPAMGYVSAVIVTVPPQYGWAGMRPTIAYSVCPDSTSLLVTGELPVPLEYVYVNVTGDVLVVETVMT